MKSGFVYIMSNHKRTVVYIGVTADIKARVAKHKEGKGSAFTSKYKYFYLVYYEQHFFIGDAIKRETQMKRWKRTWKDELIETVNPKWKDLWEEL